MAKKTGGLGRGLEALISDNFVEEGGSEQAVKLKIMDIEPNRDQPRKVFDEKSLSELADSISQHGVLQPLLVRPVINGSYQLVAGERRWRAARLAGLTEVPVIIKEMSDEEVMNPLEEALGYKNMMETLNITQSEAAEKIGKSRPVVANALRLLNLPPEVQQMLGDNLITAGHARALLGFENTEDMISTAKLIVRDDISVREIERLVKRSKKEPAARKPQKKEKFYSEVELALRNNLGRKIKIRENGKKGAGTLEIEFFDQQDLENIAMMLENYGNN